MGKTNESQPTFHSDMSSTFLMYTPSHSLALLILFSNKKNDSTNTIFLVVELQLEKALLETQQKTDTFFQSKEKTLAKVFFYSSSTKRFPFELRNEKGKMKTIIESLTSQVEVLSKQMNKPEGKPKIPQEIIDKLRMAEQKLKKAEERKQKYKVAFVFPFLMFAR